MADLSSSFALSTPAVGGNGVYINSPSYPCLGAAQLTVFIHNQAGGLAATGAIVAEISFDGGTNWVATSVDGAVETSGDPAGVLAADSPVAAISFSPSATFRLAGLPITHAHVRCKAGASGATLAFHAFMLAGAAAFDRYVVA